MVSSTLDAQCVVLLCTPQVRLVSLVRTTRWPGTTLLMMTYLRR